MQISEIMILLFLVACSLHVKQWKVMPMVRCISTWHSLHIKVAQNKLYFLFCLLKQTLSFTVKKGFNTDGFFINSFEFLLS